jgi:two-component system, OmpR family, sensor histidine kinase KdpD
MTMIPFQGTAQIVFYVVVLLALTPLLGGYMARVYEGENVLLARWFGFAERAFYRLLRTSPEEEQDWKQHARSALTFSLLFIIPLYALLRRYEDIGEVLDAGIDVISTVNIQHLESLNDLVFELSGVRVRETFPDSVLDEADEVVLVDLSPQELRDRIKAGKVYPAARAEAALANFFRNDNLQSLRQLALREVAEDVEARRAPASARAGHSNPLLRAAIQERILVLLEPSPRSARLLRRAWRSGQRLGADIDALWVQAPGSSLTEDERVALAALRRLAVLLGVHFLEEEDGDRLGAIARTVADRKTTYVFLSRPPERRRDMLGGRPQLSRLLDAMPGVDLRLCADPGDAKAAPG